MRQRDPNDRFWEKVDQSGDCWLWTASCSSKGYGYFNVGGGRIVRAHRFSYELVNGPIPEGLQLDHRCRVPSCVNPDHLRLATNKQNAEHRGGAGVSPHRDGRWQARVKHNGQDISLGIYETRRDAEHVALGARMVLFTHNDRDRGHGEEG